MPNRNIVNSTSEDVYVQIYGSNPTVPIQVDENGILKVALPGVTVISLPEVAINAMPDVTINSLPDITINSLPEVSISGLDLVDGLVGVTGIVGLDPGATVSLSGLEINDGVLMVSITPLEDGALPVQISGSPTVHLEEPIDVHIRPIPVTSEMIQMTVMAVNGDNTIYLPAKNYQRTFTPITEGYDTRGLCAYTYLIQIDNVDNVDNVSFVAIEELEYKIGDTHYFTYTTNKSPEHLLPFNGAIRLHNPNPDPDASSSRISLMAEIEDLQYRDNASYQQPALVVHNLEMEIEIEASVYLIAKREDIEISDMSE